MRKVITMRRGILILASLLVLVLLTGYAGQVLSDRPDLTLTGVLPQATGPAPAAGSELQEYPLPAGSHPHDVAPAPDGSVWYTAQAAGELGRLDPATGETHQIKLGQNSAPHGVIVGPDGAPWITDGGLNAIVWVDPQTEAVQRFPLPAGNGPANLNTATFDRQGVLWFTGQNGIYGRLDPATGEMKVFDAPRGRGPYGITTTPDGTVYYASLAGNYIARIDTETGAATVIDPPTPQQGSRRVWADSQGRVWVSQWNAGQVALYNPATGEWREWPLPGNQPRAYAVYVDEQDQVWLSDFGANALVRFNPQQETFDLFPLPSPGANVRHLLGRPGEVWGAESGTDKLVVIRTASSAAINGVPAPAPALFDLPWQDRAIFRQGLIPSEQAALDQLPGASVYHLDVQIAADLTHLQGRQEVLYTNREDKPLPEIYFRLFPNLASGASLISNLRVNGQPVEPAYEQQKSALRVPLPEPLQPGQQTVISLSFAVQVPQGAGGNYGTFAFSDGVLALAHFYPMIPAYDDKGWHIEIAPPIGDVIYADTSFYLARITAPISQTVVASGIETSRMESDHDQVLTFAGGPMRDFYVVASDRYTVTSRVVGQTTVNSYAPTEWSKGAETALDIAEAALNSFNERFGPYPYTEFDLVSTTTSALGVEYPGTAAILGDLYQQNDGQGGPLLDSVVAHEVAHQWFYSTIGNDQVNEPWLDEALAQYLTLLYFRDVHGEAGGEAFLHSLEGRWARVDRADIPIGLPVQAYDGKSYGAIVYGRGPLFLETLAETMGQDTFNAFLRDYYQTYKWGIVTTADFKQLAERHCGCDLTPLFEEWVYPKDAAARPACTVTPADIEGPYYLPDAPFKTRLAPPGKSGQPLIISGTVYSADCTPLADAVVDVWQADAAGQYDFSPDFMLRGRVKTDAQGHYEFETILPGRYGTGNAARPTHIHYKVSHPQARPLTTQLYFQGEEFGASGTSIDPALIIPLREEQGPNGPVWQGTFDIILNRP